MADENTPSTAPTAANRKYTEHADLLAAIGGAFVHATGRQPHFMLVDAIVTGIGGWLAAHDAATIRQAKAEAPSVSKLKSITEILLNGYISDKQRIKAIRQIIAAGGDHS